MAVRVLWRGGRGRRRADSASASADSGRSPSTAPRGAASRLSVALA